MSLFKEKKHYWRATLLFQTKEGQKYARWFMESESEYFPICEMEAMYMSKYGFRPTILFWGEISKSDYDKLIPSIKPYD